MSILPPIGHSERLIVVVGPSGCGKDSVLRHWRAHWPPGRVHLARRTITRSADAHEPHESVSDEDFAQLVRASEFATAWQANGLRYGVRRHELRGLADGAWVVLNGSREHLPSLRRQAPRLHVVEITASHETLAHRLRARAREDADAVARRLERRIDTAADLLLRNEGSLDEAAGALQRWWVALADR